MRADSAVEPTKSENITVTWRRSAVSWGFGSTPSAGSCFDGDAPVLGDSCQNFTPMSERDTDLFQIGIRQMAEH